jgi:hypothetical protein
MNVNLAGRSLEDHMGAHGKRAGSRLEFYDGAEKKNFAAHVIGAKLLRVRQFCILGACGSAEPHCDPKRESACFTSYIGFHIAFPHARIPPETFLRCRD